MGVGAWDGRATRKHQGFGVVRWTYITRLYIVEPVFHGFASAIRSVSERGRKISKKKEEKGRSERGYHGGEETPLWVRDGKLRAPACGAPASDEDFLAEWLLWFGLGLNFCDPARVELRRLAVEWDVWWLYQGVQSLLTDQAWLIHCDTDLLWG